MKKRALISVSLAAFIISSAASAARRVVYFNSVGKNNIVYGLENLTDGYCSITITNPSAQNQKYTLATNHTENGSSGGTLQPGPCTTYPCDLAVGSTPVTYEWRFTAIKNPSTQQSIVCSGSITAEDSSASNPGFLVAGGVLVTFLESSFETTYDVTKTSTGTQPIFSQTPISINSGKPF